MKNSDDSTSFHFIRPLPLPPIIYATIDLCFDSYLPIDALNEIIGLQATEAAPRSAMRINPLTGKQNPGYWIYKLPPMRDFDSMDLTEQLNMVLTEHETGFRKAMQKYEPAELILRFYRESSVINGNGYYISNHYSWTGYLTTASEMLVYVKDGHETVIYENYVNLWISILCILFIAAGIIVGIYFLRRGVRRKKRSTGRNQS